MSDTMTQTVVLGKNTGILLRRSQEAAGGQKLFLEILFPAGAALPETGTEVMTPPGRKGIVVHCRVTGRNTSFLRVIAEIRLREPGPEVQTTPE